MCSNLRNEIVLLHLFSMTKYFNSGHHRNVVQLYFSMYFTHLIVHKTRFPNIFWLTARSKINNN